MKIIAISDTHMYHERLDLPKGDLLIHSGDGLNRGTPQELLALNEYFLKIKDNYKKIIYVPGNHDRVFENSLEGAKNILNAATVLVDEMIEVEGLKIYGSPWTPMFMNWAFMKLDRDLKEVFSKIPKGLDILITHGPPFGILDANRDGVLCGSQSLHDQVIKVQPKLHIFGHIHESNGQVKYNQTQFINVAVLNDLYRLSFTPQVIETE